MFTEIIINEIKQFEFVFSQTIQNMNESNSQESVRFILTHRIT